MISENQLFKCTKSLTLDVSYQTNCGSSAAREELHTVHYNIGQKFITLWRNSVWYSSISIPTYPFELGQLASKITTSRSIDSGLAYIDEHSDPWYVTSMVLDLRHLTLGEVVFVILSYPIPTGRCGCAGSHWYGHTCLQHCYLSLCRHKPYVHAAVCGILGFGCSVY